ncbi:hypothetical protein K1T35_37490 [Pseudonocardia sp. DSM 110487]|uniref:hypothetical protein n=1 Tax=Pseudonocardia sp. DSM 110487 TaxID=2865833 RepID=UPI001C6A3BF6|nr:hypothetical protein [Pseudonocardia sp. DSM 110487]QYN34082.1 hypothetical protein K1T35_37490 [Pseudonocardia sp. DSM 110487]
MTTAPPASTPPSPAAATDEAAFVAELRRLKAWSGRSFRQLERQAAAAGDALPASTTATMLGKHRLPREELLVAFVRACGLGEDEMRPWLATRARLAGGTPATPTAPAAPAMRSFRWRPALTAVAALAIAFACGATLTAGLADGSSDEQETVQLTP